MEYDNFVDTISQYIDGDLSQKEKKEFERAMNCNQDYKSIFLDIKKNDLALKKLPKVTADQNFMIKLNERIDNYESSKPINIYSKYFSSILNIFTNNNGFKVAPILGTASILLVLTFSFFKVSQYSDINQVSDNKLDLNNSIAINDSDSLNSVEEEPVLLIGNGR